MDSRTLSGANVLSIKERPLSVLSLDLVWFGFALFISKAIYSYGECLFVYVNSFNNSFYKLNRVDTWESWTFIIRRD